MRSGSGLVKALAVALLVAVVFGVTVMSQYAPPRQEVVRTSGPAEEVVTGPPLGFASQKAVYDPSSEDISQKYFRAHHEITNDLVPAPFWFKNRTTKPVGLRMRGTSCGACTTARAAVLAPAEVERFVQTAVLSGLGRGASGAPDLLGALGAAQMIQSLQWKQLSLTEHNEMAVPASESAARPTLGVVQPEVKLSVMGPKNVQVAVGMKAEGAPAPVDLTFDINLVAVPAFEVDIPRLDFSDLGEQDQFRTRELTVWSATRTARELPPVKVGLNPDDGFVVAGAPEPLSPEECDKLRMLLSKKQPVRVASGYRIPVTVYRHRPVGSAIKGPPEPDLGPFERSLGVAGPGDSVANVAISARINGVVELVDGGAIDLKDFDGRFGTTRDNFALASDRPDLKLAVEPGGVTPNYLQVSLGEPRTDGGRTVWKLTVKVPPGSCTGDLPRNSVVRLVATGGAQTYRLQLPVKGKGYARGR